MGTLGVQLTESEIQELITRYRVHDGSGHVNYRSFTNKLDEVFSDQMNPSDVINNARTTAVSYKFDSFSR